MSRSEDAASYLDLPIIIELYTCESKPERFYRDRERPEMKGNEGKEYGECRDAFFRAA